MILVAHIFFALTSVLVSTALLLRPSVARLYVSYGFIAGTFVSGTVLVLTTQTRLLQTCLSGLAYTAFMLAATVVSLRKLAVAEARAQRR